MPLESILKELSTLPADDLRKIKTHIDFLTKNKSAAPVAVIKAKRSNIRGLLHVCIKRYVDVPDIAILEKNNPMHLDDKLEEISVAIETLIAKLGFDRKEGMKLCQVIVEAAVEKIKAKKDYPLSFTTIMYQMGEPRSLLDENFPGYLTSGLFKAYVLR